MNTIHFVISFFKFAPSQQLLQSVAKWLNVKERSTKTIMDEVVSTITAKDHAKDELLERVLKLVDQASNSEFPANFDFSAEGLDAAQLASVTTPRYIHGYLGAQNRIKEFLDKGILLFLRHPLLSEHRMLCLFHMLRQFVMLTPSIPKDVIESAIQCCKKYYLWPKPYGEVAEDMLKLLTIELKSPGAAQRKRILQETPTLAPSPELKVSGKERTIWVLIGAEFDESKIIESLLKESYTPMTIQELQANILKGALSSALGCFPSQLIYVQHLTRDELAKYTSDVLKILHSAVLMKQEESENFRKQQLIQLNEVIRTKVGSFGTEDTMGIDLISNDIKEPCLEFEFIKINAETGSQHLGNLIGNERIPAFLLRDSFRHISEQYQHVAASRPPVKLLVLGDDRTIHSVINGYYSFYAQAPDYFKHLDFQIYLGPLENCEFSSFISRYDGWYGRNVAIALQSTTRMFPVMIAPELFHQKFYEDELNRKSQNTLPFIDEQQMSPGIFLRDELQHFVRDARWRLNVNLYKCECHIVSNKVSSFFTVAFCERVEIGSNAEAFAAKKNNPKDFSNLSSSQIMTHKNFKYTGIPLTIKHTQMNVINVARNTAPIEPSTYSQVVLSNIPFKGDKGVPSHPSKQWLEMSLWEKKKKTEEFGPSSYHSASVEIEASDKKKNFHVLIDKFFKDLLFKKGRISPSKTILPELRIFF